jgi:hypothetical protein
MKKIVNINTTEDVIRSAVIATLKQGERCESNHRCKYYYRGNRCIVGHMVSEDDAKLLVRRSRNLDDSTISNLRIMNHVEVGVGDVQVLVDLQSVHDGDDPMHWFENFNKVLKKHNIKPIERTFK